MDLKTLPKTAIFPIQQKAINGDPDYLLCIAGHFVALELKAELGIVSKLQRYKLERVSKSGGRAFVAFPDTWPFVFGALQRLAYKQEKV